MAVLFEEGSDAVHSKTYRAAQESLTCLTEIKTAKHLVKNRLERMKKGRRKGERSRGERSAAGAE